MNVVDVIESIKAGAELVNYGKHWELECDNGATDVSCQTIMQLESCGAVNIILEDGYARAELNT